MKKYYFFLDKNNITHGPVFVSYFSDNGISSTTKVWFEGLPHWVVADSVPELRRYIKDNGVESMSEHKYVKDGKYKYDNVHNVPPNIDKNSTADSKMPKTWLLESILVTVFCCLPLGIVGIIYASKVSSLWQMKHYAEAIETSDKAKVWTKWGLMITLIILLIYVLLLVLVPSTMDTIRFFDRNMGVQ